MRKSLHGVFLSCLKASQLVEKQQIFGLNISELIQMEAHLLICKGCNQYKIQSLFIAKGIKEKIEQGETHIQISSEELERVKTQILSKLS